MSDTVEITLSFLPKVAAHILDVLAVTFDSDDPLPPAVLIKLAVMSFVIGEWLKTQGDGGE